MSHEEAFGILLHALEEKKSELVDEGDIEENNEVRKYLNQAKAYFEDNNI